METAVGLKPTIIRVAAGASSRCGTPSWRRNATSRSWSGSPSPLVPPDGHFLGTHQSPSHLRHLPTPRSRVSGIIRTISGCVSGSGRRIFQHVGSTNIPCVTGCECDRCVSPMRVSFVPKTLTLPPPCEEPSACIPRGRRICVLEPAARCSCERPVDGASPGGDSRCPPMEEHESMVETVGVEPTS
jgi:hypothetical protein